MRELMRTEGLSELLVVIGSIGSKSSIRSLSWSMMPRRRDGWKTGKGGGRSCRRSQWQADMLWVMHSGNSRKGHTEWHLLAIILVLLSLRAIICLIRLPSTACVIPDTAFSPTKATSENKRAKRRSLPRLSDVMFLQLHGIWLTGSVLRCV